MNTTPKRVSAHAFFTEAYRDYMQELIRRARFMINNPDLSEDLVQEVYLKMWLYMMRGGKVDKARAFLHHALSNVIVDVYRKHKTLSLDSLLERGYEASTDDSERLINTLDGEKVFSHIKQLPRPYQKILRMKYALGLPYSDISRTTGQSQNTIAVQVHRGLKKLKLLCNFA